MRLAASPLWLAISFGATGTDVADFRGKFITIEGGEGVGKSTQAALLTKALGACGIPVQATREPGGTPGAEVIRRLLVEGERDRWDAVSESLLLIAARRDHVNRLIAPALAQGKWVVSDRFADSTLAYQGFGKGVALAQLTALHGFALGDFAPDLTLILDLPIEVGLARAAARSAGDRFERLDGDIHERLRQGFRQIAADNPVRCVLIDASGDPQTVHAAMVGTMERRFGMALAPHPRPASAGR